MTENGTPGLTEAFARRVSIKSILEAQDSGASELGSTVVIAGWVKTGREQGSGAHEPWAFLELNDGSSFLNMQVVHSAVCSGTCQSCVQLLSKGVCSTA